MTDVSAKGLLIAHLLEHSIKHGDFTLKSGKKSPYFLDSKQTACDPDGVVLMTDVALEHIPSDATAIGGLTVERAPGVLAAGADSVSVVTDITLNSDPEARTRAWLEAVAARADAGDASPDWVAEVCTLKNQATQTMQFCADAGVQILGGMGYMRGTVCERIYREVKVITIGGGTEEIMKELAARQWGIV